MSSFVSDVRFAVRSLLLRPTHSLIAVVTLTLGIGANAAMFSLIQGVLLAPLPYESPDRLAFLWNQFPGTGEMELRLSQAELTDWRAASDLFEGVAGISTGEQNMLWTMETDDGRTERWSGAFVTANFFDVLGVQPRLGRTFLMAEETRGNHLVMILSDEFWRARFNADTSILGRTLRIAGQDREVVGVMPPGFHSDLSVTSAGAADFWVIQIVDPTSPRVFRFLNTIARLRDSVALEGARAAVSQAASTMEASYPEAYPAARAFRVAVQPLHERIVGDVKTPLLVLLATVGAVLLIVVVNVTNLLLVRAETRRHELAIRTALGASRVRILRPFVVEGLLLTGAGGVIGTTIAALAVRIIREANPADLPLIDAVALDAKVVGLAVAIAVGTGLVVGLVPGWRAVGLGVEEVLRGGGRGATTGAAPHRLWRTLVSSEIAIAVVLVVVASMLIESFRTLAGVAPGIRPNQVLSMRMDYPTWQYPEIDLVRETHTRVLQSVGGLPGVQSASIAHAEHPLRLNGQWHFRIDGEPADPNDPRPMVGIRVVSAAHLETLGIPLMVGRSFDDTDRDGAPFRILVNQTLARTWFPDANAIGQRLIAADPMPPTMKLEIIGVYGDVKNEGLRGAVRPAMLLPYTNAAFATGWQRHMSLLVRTDGKPADLTAAVRAAVASVDPGLVVSQVQTLDDVMARQVATAQFLATLLGGFAVLALALGALGTYGVVAYVMQQRTAEMGVRVALGARPASVIALVFRQGMALAGFGVGIGLLIAAGVTQLLAGVLFGVNTSDVSSFTIAPMLLIAVCGVAILVPAHRASTVDPTEALRHS